MGECPRRQPGRIVRVQLTQTCRVSEASHWVTLPGSAIAEETVKTQRPLAGGRETPDDRMQAAAFCPPMPPTRPHLLIISISFSFLQSTSRLFPVHADHCVGRLSTNLCGGTLPEPAESTDRPDAWVHGDGRNLAFDLGPSRTSGPIGDRPARRSRPRAPPPRGWLPGKRRTSKQSPLTRRGRVLQQRRSHPFGATVRGPQRLADNNEQRSPIRCAKTAGGQRTPRQPATVGNLRCGRGRGARPGNTNVSSS